MLGVAIPFAFAPAPVMMGNWFRRRRGGYVGIAMARSGIGETVMEPVSGALINRWDGGFAPYAVSRP